MVEAAMVEEGEEEEVLSAEAQPVMAAAEVEVAAVEVAHPLACTTAAQMAAVASDASAAVQMAAALTMAATTSCTGGPLVPAYDAAGVETDESKISNAKRPWTSEEDALLMEAIQKYGTQRWPLIANHVQRGRAGKQCRERWFNHLCPNVKKGDWTEEEDRIIQEGVLELGTKWSEIVKRLPGRTDNSIKNRYNSQQRREQRRARAAAQGAAKAVPPGAITAVVDHPAVPVAAATIPAILPPSMLPPAEAMPPHAEAIPEAMPEAMAEAVPEAMAEAMPPPAEATLDGPEAKRMRVDDVDGAIAVAAVAPAYPEATIAGEGSSSDPPE